jgi:hypothetical protein
VSIPSRSAILRYRCVTDDGLRLVEPSGEFENTNASGDISSPSAAARASHRWRCSVSAATVPGSIVTYLRWWVLVSFSSVSLPSWAMARRTVTTARPRSTWRHCNAHSSPRRAPLTIVSQTSIPQSGSARNASAIKRAASSGVGGCGSGDGTGGGSAWSIGLTLTHRQRTARL